MTHPPVEPDLESGYPSPAIVDSRRLMGPNLMHAGLGAVLDVTLHGETPARNAALLTAWHARVADLADALGWPDAQTTQRVYPGGASLFVHAPIDQLMTATEVCESAWVFAESVVDGTAPLADELTVAPLLAFAQAEPTGTRSGRRSLLELWNEAQRLGLNLTFDETSAFVGSGAGAQGWPLDAIPALEAIDWLAVSDIPIVLVTGSNGKTTVVRMVAAMATAAGHTVGYTCTDGVWIGGTQVERGDWSGPAGARRVLQDASVTLAVLETARGGLLRRGLALQRATVAAIVTLSADHFGDYGITDLATLAEAKMVVARAVEETGTLVINSAIPELVAAAASHCGTVLSVCIDSSNRIHAETRGRGEGRRAAGVERPDGEAERMPAGTSPRPRVPARALFDATMGVTPEELAGIPATLNGTATHNVLNATVALAIAHELHLGRDSLEALKRFGADPRDNMGRLMRYEVGGVTVVVDYAHNPQGVTALIDATRDIPAQRRAIALGTGGDRDDAALHAIAAAAVHSGVIDLYIAKEMPKFLRGRLSGSISGVLLAALHALGAPDANLVEAASDMDAARAALQWARTGDLILLPIHDERDAVLALLAMLTRTGWQAGAALPA
ncbi:MAG: Mur ligase family protein [Gemmatimonadaceae bacterium]|nr:Mur ligase family protein [Gemmatimonadaceae bacterium]